MTKNIIKRIIELRNSKKLKQIEFASMINMTQGSYSKIELGKTELTLDRLYKIAEALEVSVKYLLFGEEEINNGNIETLKKDNEILREYKKISKNSINIFLDHYFTTYLVLELQNITKLEKGNIINIDTSEINVLDEDLEGVNKNSYIKGYLILNNAINRHSKELNEVLQQKEQNLKKGIREAKSFEDIEKVCKKIFNAQHQDIYNILIMFHQSCRILINITDNPFYEHFFNLLQKEFGE